jgi:hypothetical protein
MSIVLRQMVCHHEAASIASIEQPLLVAADAVEAVVDQ